MGGARRASALGLTFLLVACAGGAGSPTAPATSSTVASPSASIAAASPGASTSAQAATQPPSASPEATEHALADLVLGEGDAPEGFTFDEESLQSVADRIDEFQASADQATTDELTAFWESQIARIEETGFEERLSRTFRGPEGVTLVTRVQRHADEAGAEAEMEARREEDSGCSELSVPESLGDDVLATDCSSAGFQVIEVDVRVANQIHAAVASSSAAAPVEVQELVQAATEAITTQVTNAN